MDIKLTRKWVYVVILMSGVLWLLVDFLHSYDRYKREYRSATPMYYLKYRHMEYFEFSHDKLLKRMAIAMQNDSMIASVRRIERDASRPDKGMGSRGELSREVFEKFWKLASNVNFETRKCEKTDFADKVWGLFLDDSGIPKTVIVSGKDLETQKLKVFLEEAEKIEREIVYTDNTLMPLIHDEKRAYWLAKEPIQYPSGSVGSFALMWLRQKYELLRGLSGTDCE